MRERTKRALLITGLWSLAGTVLFVLNTPGGGIIENIVWVLAFFTPVQFAITLVFSWLFLSGHTKRGKALLMLDRLFNWLADKKIKTRYCVECEDWEGKKVEATWKAWYARWWVREYPKSRVDYFCDSCLIGNLEGIHTGGGPTISSYKKLVRLFNPVDSEIQASKKAKKED
jgi:hypothetical protein